MQRIVASRWFALADLLLVAAAGTIWYVFPNVGGWLLVIALLPWFARLAAGQFPFKRTLFDFPLGVFLVTAAVGVWAAYDREGAWAKFWLLVAGILLFYALANQPDDNLQIIAGLLGALAGGIAVFFLLTYNWQDQSADFKLLNHLGQWWMAIRPSVKVEAPLPNLVGGILAMLLPYTFVLGLSAWRKRQWLGLGFAVIIGGLTSVSLLMTSSRAAWGALALVLVCWLLWVLVGNIFEKSELIVEKKVLNRRRLFALLIFLSGGLVVAFTINLSAGIGTLIKSVPGLSDGGSRLNLYMNTLPLLQDFIFTGGGLGSFAGLYSRYVLVIPQFFFGYSHNLYLDIAVEQGIFGILAFISIFFASIWILVAPKKLQSFHWAILASLLVIGLHGLLDDSLYGERGTPLLFLSMGLAMAVIQPRKLPLNVYSGSFIAEHRNWLAWGLVAVCITLTLLVFLFNRPILASWYADLGAVEMARVELLGFPTGKWVDSDVLIELAPAERLLERGLQFSPSSRTANYRLGLIAMLHRDYSNAVNNLETAYSVGPANRGIRKNLGYSYVWQGEFEQAAKLLQTIPEARNEMDAYAWWWETKGREDLSSNASHMVQILHSGSLISSGTVPKP